MSRIADGEYVLATKYSDGDPGDEWAVGFLKARMNCYARVRYDVQTRKASRSGVTGSAVSNGSPRRLEPPSSRTKRR